MKNKIKYSVIAILTSLSVFINPLSVCASSPADTSLIHYSEMSKADKWIYTYTNFTTFLSDGLGVVVSQINGGNASFRDAWVNWLIEQKRIDSADSMGEYIDSHTRVENDSSGQLQLILDDSMSDDLYTSIKQYLDANTGWTFGTTYQVSDLVNYFGNKNTYDTVKEIVDGMQSDEVALVSPYWYQNSSGVNDVSAIVCIVKNDGFLNACFADTTILGGQSYYKWELSYWKMSSGKCHLYYINSNGEDWTERYFSLVNSSYDDEYSKYQGFLFESSLSTSLQRPKNSSFFIVKKNHEKVRLYKSVSDYKAYSVGQRPYYATSDFYDYSVGKDNALTISDDALQNGSVYGDVQNYVVNNGGDGMTEEELRKLLDEYLGGGGGGTGGGTGGSTSGGGGLDGLLGGLGAFGDAIMRIAGKLIEYIGKLLELVTTSFTGILDKIPTGFVGLLGALFPFIPEEVISVLGLGITLILIIALIKALKK